MDASAHSSGTRLLDVASTMVEEIDSPKDDHSRYYITVAGVGYDAQVVYKLSAWLKKNLGVTGLRL